MALQTVELKKPNRPGADIVQFVPGPKQWLRPGLEGEGILISLEAERARRSLVKKPELSLEPVSERYALACREEISSRL